MDLFTHCPLKVIVSIYGERYPLEEEQVKAFQEASFVVADHAFRADQLRAFPSLQYTPVYSITPYDIRFTPGISQRIRTLKIFMPIRELKDIEKIPEILDYMAKHPTVDLYFGLYNYDPNFANLVKETIRPVSDMYQLPFDEKQVDEVTTYQKPRLFIKVIMSHNDLMSVLRDIRLIVDLRDHPDILSQMSAIAVGIPTIVANPVEYISHLENGIILAEGYSLTQALAYYLESLNHWNESLVYCFNLVNNHTKQKIVSLWKEILADVEERGEEDESDHERKSSS
jgi:accessory secretory protein Asp1